MSFANRRFVALVLFVVVVQLAVLSGCAGPRPVLYPNEQYQRAGEAGVERDTQDCMRQAKEFVGSGGATATGAGRTARNTAVGGATGAAIGAVGGAVSGNPGEGAAVGAATGATAGLFGSLFNLFGTSDVDPVYANFVDRCLRERGYEPIGWK